MMSLLNDLVPDRKDQPECKGVFLRGERSTWSNYQDRIGQKMALKLLKRRSCRGCPECGCFWDFISNCDLNEDLNLSNIEPGKMYTPVFKEDFRDWETNTVEDYHYEFKEVTE